MENTSFCLEYIIDMFDCQFVHRVSFFVVAVLFICHITIYDDIKQPQFKQLKKVTFFAKKSYN